MKIRVNVKILCAGIAMLVVGMSTVAYLHEQIPAGRPGMTDDAIIELLLEERENEDIRMIASILAGVGFLLILVSFGTAKGEGRAKRTIKKDVQ